MSADASEQSDAIHAGHVDIADCDQDSRRRADERERFFTARSSEAGVPIRLEHGTNELQNCRIIVNDEDQGPRRVDVRPSICWLHLNALSVKHAHAHLSARPARAQYSAPRDLFGT
jgi:hypothetical protein